MRFYFCLVGHKWKCNCVLCDFAFVTTVSMDKLAKLCIGRNDHRRYKGVST